MAVAQLKAQDIVVALKLVAHAGERPPIAELARALRISGSEVHSSLRRLAASHLYSAQQEAVLSDNLLEVLRAVRFVFPARPGAISVGLPTAHTAPPLAGKIAHGPSDAVVWSWGPGEMEGQTIEPLYRTVPDAAAEDSALHELLALVDALRVGKARERLLAVGELERRLCA